MTRGVTPGGRTTRGGARTAYPGVGASWRSRPSCFNSAHRSAGIFARTRSRLATNSAAERGPGITAVELRDALYSQTHPRLQQAALRNVLAHLLKLEAEGKAVCEAERWRAV